MGCRWLCLVGPGNKIISPGRKDPTAVRDGIREKVEKRAKIFKRDFRAVASG
jgi:hypothetical protein